MAEKEKKNGNGQPKAPANLAEQSFLESTAAIGVAELPEHPEPRDADAPVLYRIWSTNDCPEKAPTVCGIDFPRETDPFVRDEKGQMVLTNGGEPRREFHRGQLIKMRPSKVAEIEKRLREPVKFDGGRLVSGKVAMDDVKSPLGPLGKWLHIQPANGMPASRAEEVLGIEKAINGMWKEIDRLYQVEDSDEPADVRRDKQEKLRKQIKELEAKKLTLAA